MNEEQTLPDCPDVWWADGYNVKDENGLHIGGVEIVERIAELQKALQGLLTDVMEVREATGAYEAQDPNGPEPGAWWDTRVTAGLANIYAAQKLLGEEDR